MNHNRIATRGMSDEERCEYYRRQRRAQWAARVAVRKGVIKVQPCQKCGAERVDMHHEDYSKPLEVVFLCRFHHTLHHRYRRATTTAPAEVAR